MARQSCVRNFCSNEMVKFDAFVFELREAIRNDGTVDVDDANESFRGDV